MNICGWKFLLVEKYINLPTFLFMMKKNLLIGLLFVVWAASAFSISTLSAKPSKKILRVATFNNEKDFPSKKADSKWTTRCPLVVRLLKEENFDIIGMQEPYWNQIQDLQKRTLVRVLQNQLVTALRPASGHHVVLLLIQRRRLRQGVENIRAHHGGKQAGSGGKA